MNSNYDHFAQYNSESTLGDTKNKEQKKKRSSTSNHNAIVSKSENYTRLIISIRLLLTTQKPQIKCDGTKNTVIAYVNHAGFSPQISSMRHVQYRNSYSGVPDHWRSLAYSWNSYTLRLCKKRSTNFLLHYWNWFQRGQLFQ